MKIHKLEVQNYQDINNIKLEFCPTINVIYDNSNIYKNSIIHLLSNLPNLIFKNNFSESNTCITVKFINEKNFSNFKENIFNNLNKQEMFFKTIYIDFIKIIQKNNINLLIRNLQNKDPDIIALLEKICNTIKKIDSNFGNIELFENDNEKFLIIYKNEKPLNIEKLPPSEFLLISLIIDIYISINQLIVYNPIILINEIDFNLHPKIQINLINVLKQDFPNTQFIITSCSPFIWANLYRDNIICLDYDNNKNIVQKDIDFAKGASITDIITRYFNMDSYPADISKKFHDIDEFIRNKDIDNATKSINSLQLKYGPLPIISQFLLKIRMLGL